MRSVRNIMQCKAVQIIYLIKTIKIEYNGPLSNLLLAPDVDSQVLHKLQQLRGKL